MGSKTPIPRAPQTEMPDPYVYTSCRTWRYRLMLSIVFAAALFLIQPLTNSVPALAGDVEVVKVKIAKESAGTYRFDVTLRHKDEGWKHYADRWDVVSPDGTVLGSRTLHHPHVREQPFTRSLSSLRIPKELMEVVVRAHDKVHGIGQKPVRVTVPR